MSDVEGIVERLREMGEFFGPNIPTRPVREKLSAVDARHCDEASALMLEAASELQSRDATISRLEGGGLGWLYTCDDGWAWSENHPIDSGESVYATNVRRATNAELVERLKDLSEGHNEALASEARASARVAAAEARAQEAEAALGEARKFLSVILMASDREALRQTIDGVLSKQEGGK